VLRVQKTVVLLGVVIEEAPDEFRKREAWRYIHCTGHPSQDQDYRDYKLIIYVPDGIMIMITIYRM